MRPQSVSCARSCPLTRYFITIGPQLKWPEWELVSVLGGKSSTVIQLIQRRWYLGIQDGRGNGEDRQRQKAKPDLAMLRERNKVHSRCGFGAN